MAHVKFEDEDPETLFDRKKPRIKRKVKSNFITNSMDVLVE